MRFNDKNVHMRLFRATDQLEAAMYQTGQDAEFMARVNKHMSIWTREYGKGCLLGSLAMVGGTLGLSVLLQETVGKPWGAIAFLVGLGISLAIGARAYMKNRRTFTAEELRNLEPILNLDDVGRAYARAIIEIPDHPNLSETEKAEMLSALYQLVEESERLDAELERLAGRQDVADATRVQEEVRKLESQVAQATDPMVQEALEKSLELARERLDRFIVLAPRQERVEAQREVIRQTLLSVSETLRILANQSQPVVESDMRSLRERISDVRIQTRALEATVAEVQTL